MSQAELPHRFEHITICSSSPINSDEQFVQYLSDIKEISLQEGFRNRIVDMNSDDPDQSEIYFGESGGSDPREAENYISIDKLNEDELHVHAEFSEGVMDIVPDILRNITEITGTLKINTIHTRGDTLIDFESLDLPVDFDHPTQPNGVRFLYDDDIHLIQQVNPAHIEHILEENEEEINQDILFWRTEHRVETEVSASEIKSFIDEFIDEVRQAQADIADHELQ